jgi:hypothetical protein
MKKHDPHMCTFAMHIRIMDYVRKQYEAKLLINLGRLDLQSALCRAPSPGTRIVKCF